jgi:DNA helicase II / ATP-dependent DNA helicase PcrA
MNISLEDIQWVQELMQRDFSSSEHKAVLQFPHSCNIQASPGSGKTTSLVAKLAILLKNQTQEGVCVLSHTNVAKDEVLARLVEHGFPPIRHPHFVGTIQNFVNSFLAIPAAHIRFDARATFDDKTFSRHLWKHYKKYGQTLYPTLFALLSQKKKRLGTFDYNTTIKSPLETLTYDVSTSGQSLIGSTSHLRRSFDDSDAALEEAFQLKEALSAEGFFRFDDAYALANWLLKYDSAVAGLVAKRFRYVFVDEVQDTDPGHAGALFGALSQCEVVQTFGDNNQTIYGESTPPSRPDKCKELSLPVSQRITSGIANLVRPFALSKSELIGRIVDKELPHTLYLYRPSTVTEVLHEHNKLLQSLTFKDGQKARHIAVGFRQSASKVGVTLSHYWPQFPISSPSYALGFEANEAQAMKHVCEDRVSDAVATLSSLLAMVLNYCDVMVAKKPVSSDTLHLALTPDELSSWRFLLLNWLTHLKSGETVRRDWLCAELSKLFPVALSSGLSTEATEFIYADAGVSTIHSSSNLFLSSKCESPVPIRVTTIHSVKGQTHTSALFLNTHLWKSGQNIDHCSQIFPFVTDHSKIPVADDASFLCTAYVALSRASELVCMAVQEEVATPYLGPLSELGWNIRVV